MPTFPHGLVLLGGLDHPGHGCARLRLVLVHDGLEGRLEVHADIAGYLCAAARQGGEVDPHETQDHVVRDVREVIGDHVRGIENLGQASSDRRRHIIPHSDEP